MMKRILSLAMAGLLTAGLAACGASGPNTAYSTAPAQSIAAPEAGAEEALDYYSETADEPAEIMEDDTWRYAEIEPDEEYDGSEESPFKNVATSPLSTFSSDVDTASYSNMRRFVNMGQKPEGVRIEELVNYFEYDYERPGPNSEHPFSIQTEVAPCPWNEEHLLAMVGVQGEALENSEDMANNIVFLLDVSGSMGDENKLPLLQESFKLLIDKLGKNDVISIVTYAGSDRVAADSVRGDKHRQLKRLIDDLYAGGSTAGARGLETAYALAEKNFIEGGNNRVILATDGDFNVGQSSTEALKAQIEAARESGVYISVLGFGMYNLKDNMMETIAGNGNGNYAYIDNLAEAKKVLVDEFDSTMYTIANDLKFQVEFNPAVVYQYRLVGYNNRRLADEDFNDDKKDAGDVGAGHSVTAFYELVPLGAEAKADVDDLIYQQQSAAPAAESGDYMTVKVRYKRPGEDTSRLVQQVVNGARYTETPSASFEFASAVAEYGLILTDSRYRANSSLNAVIERAGQNLGKDGYGLRAEFVQLARQYKSIVD